MKTKIIAIVGAKVLIRGIGTAPYACGCRPFYLQRHASIHERNASEFF
ncbi:hypothetical protein [Brevibacillus laterosporus]|nr:hypothetical protein [Brevibacillus laterosporus]